MRAYLYEDLSNGKVLLIDMVSLIVALIFSSHGPIAPSLATGVSLYRPSQNGDSCCPSMAQFVSDPKFLAAHFTPPKLAWQATIGKMVHFAAPFGGEASGFYVPPTARSKVAIIMVHEYWGLNDFMKRTAEKLHNDTGYAVLAVDLYDGKVATDPSEAGKLMADNNEQRSASIISGGFSALAKDQFGFKPTHIGTVGYCFGGGWSERAAIIGSNRVQACVVYYGLPDIRPASLARLKAPVLMFQALQDQWINGTVVGNFKSAMATAGKQLQVVPYDANHAFANPSNPHFNAEVSADAYRRELAFFKSKL